MNSTYTYAKIAPEYYDADRHPTCANFRQLGLLGVSQTVNMLTRDRKIDEIKILETGAGMSTVAEYFSAHKINLQNVTLQDKFAEMLDYSQRWQNQLSDLFLSDAKHLPIADASVDCLASFLLDPYDTVELWAEASRVLRNHGRWVITSPSHEWAMTFRDENNIRSSEFVNSNGELFALPSYTYPASERINNLQTYGFHLEYFRELCVQDISGTVSPKLLSDGPKEPVLDYFIFFKK